MVVKLTSDDGLVLGCKIGYMFRKMLGLILETTHGIRFGLEKRTKLRFLTVYSEGSIDVLLDGISLGR